MREASLPLQNSQTNPRIRLAVSVAFAYLPIVLCSIIYLLGFRAMQSAMNESQASSGVCGGLPSCTVRCLAVNPSILGFLLLCLIMRPLCNEAPK